MVNGKIEFEINEHLESINIDFKANKIVVVYKEKVNIEFEEHFEAITNNSFRTNELRKMGFITNE